MLRNLTAVFAFAIVLTVASCRVARDAPKSETVISDGFEDITKGLKLFQDNVMEILGVKNTAELQKKAADTGKDIAAKLDVWANEIKKETEGWKDLAVVKDLQSTVDKTISEFKAKNPETAEEIKAFYEKTSKGTEDVVQKIKALSESEDANKLKDLSKKLLETASNTIQNIAQDVQENLKKP